MMILSVLLVLACITGFVPKIKAQNQCSRASFSRQINWKMKCGVFKTLATDSLDCQEQCSVDLNCFSINTYQSDNGTEICELMEGSKDSEEEGCLVRSTGSVYNELSEISSCSSSGQCKASELTRKAWPKEWYQLGSFKYKHFKKRQTWENSNSTCSAHGGSLAAINSELEHRFITERFLKSFSAPNALDTIKPLYYWKLDGSDQDVVLQGSAKFQKIQYGITTALNLLAKVGSYATTPAPAIQSTSFTIALWLKYVEEDQIGGLMYGYWQDPYIGTFYLEKSASSTAVFIGADFRRKSNHLASLFIIKGGNVKKSVWTHVALTWDRATKKAQLFQEGNRVAEVTSSAGNDDLDLPDPLRSVFDIGYKRDSQTYLISTKIGRLAIFDRALTSNELKYIEETPSMQSMSLYYELWVAKSNAFNKFSSIIRNPDSTCVSVKAREQGNMNKVNCVFDMEFICKKPV